MNQHGCLSRREFLRFAGIASAGALLPRWALGAGAPASGPARKPNVVFILADDLGWMDTSLYGSRYYHTPNIDRLAARGMMFTDAYAASPLCSPTRASIMTGKYPARLGITSAVGHLPDLPQGTPVLAEKAPAWMQVVAPESKRHLPPAEYTLGEAFRDAGYATAFIGKWHLGVAKAHWPERQGFDVVFHGAPDPGPPSYVSPYGFKAGTVTDGPAGQYITDRVTDEAVKFIRSNAGRPEKPFFLCLWHYAVHAPFQGKKALIERYRKQSDPRGKQNCPTMAAMIHSLDQGVGAVLEELDKLKIADNTIVVFMSDNGGNMYSRVGGTTPTNNAPLRGGKATLYEGGTREPCVIAWPGHTPGGSRCSEPITSIDFYPTLLGMAGIERRKGQVIDGVNLTPLLTQKGGLDRQAVFCHFPHYTPATGNRPGAYVRKGDWKLIRYWGEGADTSKPAYELYNLKDDISEQKNLAAAKPERVAELNAMIDGFLKDTSAAVPIPNPAYDPKDARAPKGKGKG